MSLNLMKIAVGIDDPTHLASLLRTRVIEVVGGFSYIPHLTRYQPRRAGEILSGGSLYWVIKGNVQARQVILAFEPRDAGTDGKRCEIRLAPELILTEAYPRRPFQGWRYLDGQAAPPDLRPESDAPPGDMARDLRALGLI